VELWAGIESTVCRRGDFYYDQCFMSGFDARPNDLELIAGLGITALRFPVVWEKIAPRGLHTAVWGPVDCGLARLAGLGVTPIVGLLHHGSGPAGTDLLDPTLPVHLAEFAAAFARRHPEVLYYTPVNEPLTTARFSCLYGHWYPHRRDDRSFVRALVIQVRAVRAAMAAIRGINPAAKLVQTEDIGFTHAPALLAYQAAFENERRWLSFDLLSGRVGPRHKLRPYLLRNGADEGMLDELVSEPAAPDIYGINHYLSSERWLDPEPARYPEHVRGGNGQHAYADVLAARALEATRIGPEAILRECWARYGAPIAVTEAHNGSSREEQARWFLEMWDAAAHGAADGIDVRAVTAWAVLGSFDWDCLLTEWRGRYEVGVFDVRGAGGPRPTMLVPLLRDLAAGRRPDHPVLDVPGWWHRPDRYDPPECPVRAAMVPSTARPILLAGAGGTLGRAFLRRCTERGLAVHPLTRGELDIGDADSIAAALARHQPWAVINAAGYVRVEQAEREPDACWRSNVIGAELLAQASAAAGVPLLAFSSDLVFSGAADEPYVETDPAEPVGIYGTSKREGEKRMLACHPQALIVRSAAFFGPWDRHNFVIRVLDCLSRGRSFAAAGDGTVSPTYVPWLVDAALDLLIDGETGIWHITNETPVSWLELAREVADRAGLDKKLICATQRVDNEWSAARRRYSALRSERATLLPTLGEALALLFDQLPRHAEA
jgi:dTDP-4-dehydrorhamnose reductase